MAGPPPIPIDGPDQGLARLAAARAAAVPILGLRARAERLAAACLALLFPQLDDAPAGPPPPDPAADLLARLADLQALVADVVARARAGAGPAAVDPEHLGHALSPEDIAGAFTASLPYIHAALLEDAWAHVERDPAARGVEEVVLAYPGFRAVAVHRLAHRLLTLGVPLVPRLLAALAQRDTGIDIHPGATIGRAFSIDHGTGVVIGETTVIGDRVTLYQGVTLGAAVVDKRLARRKRHPTVGDGVVIYANATILGGSTTIGAGSVIGGNVWLTRSVPPYSVVTHDDPTPRARSAAPDGDPLDFHI